ncbi:acyl carrier protein [Tenacibaculum ascidiaceicola]|uniref:acyl carrier protein n=1 Tax=Tenacibaculum ascidiaceicola TaxID=1699411 RepID=UPI003CE581EC
MIQEVTKIIKEILAENGESTDIKVTESSRLKDLGLSSFDLATLTVKIEDKYGVDVFEDGLVFQVSEIVDILENKKK